MRDYPSLLYVVCMMKSKQITNLSTAHDYKSDTTNNDLNIRRDETYPAAIAAPLSKGDG